MLEVYMDRKMTLAFVKLLDKNKEELAIDKRMKMTKSESFIKQACKLKLDKRLAEHNNSIVTLFTQGVGDDGQVKLVELDHKTIRDNKCAVAFLESGNPLHSIVSKTNLTINQERLNENLTSLMFIAPNQTTVFQIFPDKYQTINKNAFNGIIFNGLNSLYEYPLVQLSDVLIVDAYFLKPEGFKNTNDKYDLSAYVENSIVPLMKLLHYYSINNQLTINIFTEWQKESYSQGELLFNLMTEALQKHNLNIKLLIVVAQHLNQHDKMLYSNYFSINSGLSFHQFQQNRVTGYKKSKVSINPFAVDNLSTDPHLEMMNDLAHLFQVFIDYNTSVFGIEEDLSPMLIQAHNQLNPTNQ